jgi:hypothetical protein
LVLLQAVLQLEKVAEAGDIEWLTDVLLRRLADDDEGVTLAVLDSPLLLKVPAATLFDALSRCLQRAVTAICSPVQIGNNTPAQRGVARKVCSFATTPHLSMKSLSNLFALQASNMCHALHIVSKC